MLNLEYTLECVKQWAITAGDYQLSHFRVSDFDVAVKLNESDIVTSVDKQTETIIINCIRKEFSDHDILSEESGESIQGRSDYLWVIDPLDGTTNYSTGLPIFAVSIALKYKGVTQLGVVYAPRLGEMFAAIRGKGAELNGKAINCKTNTYMSRAVVSTGFPIDKNQNPDNNMDNLARILPLVRGVRRLGSAAIDICYVAAGVLDGYWELNLHEWDVAAALLIAEESGARYSYFRQDRGVSVAVASDGIFDELMKSLSDRPYENE
ncbi:MAG: inositol monophosphatase [Paramuribaculum sp.]|nr:inositol monophosphatase [Paramuribaculum sp.]